MPILYTSWKMITVAFSVVFLKDLFKLGTILYNDYK